MVHAWLDGELSADEAARVERLVAEDAEWAAAAAEARGLVAASSRILSALDVVAGDVIPRGGSAAPAFGGSGAAQPDIAPRIASRRAMPTWLRVAAGAVFIAGVAYMGRSTTETARISGVGAVDETAATAPGVPSAPAAADAPSPPALNKEAERGIAANAPTPRRADAPSAAVADAVVAPSPAATIAARPTEPPSAEPELRGVAGGVASGVQVQRAEPLVAKGVVGGVVPSAAGGATSMAAAPSSLAASARADAANKAEFATAERRAAETRSLRQAAIAPATLEGCWRLETTARADPIQRALPIVRIVGDTTFTALAPDGIAAWVVRESPNLLRGRTRDSAGAPVPLRATQVGCPVSP